MTLAKARTDLALVRDTLLGNATFAALNAQVRIANVNDPDVGTVDYPVVILDVTAGNARYHGSLRDLTLDLYAYSNLGPDEASRVYDVVFAALQATRLVARDRTVIGAAGYAREVDRPEPGYNDQTRSWYMRGTWVVMTAG